MKLYLKASAVLFTILSVICLYAFSSSAQRSSAPNPAPDLQAATPLVYRGAMFLPNPADVLQAIDAATGDLIWEYRRPVPEDISKFLQGSPLKNRNIAIYGDKIIDLSVDTFVYAVEARSGKPAWQTRIQDYRELPAMQTSGPIAARGKVFSGRACKFSAKARLALSPRTMPTPARNCGASTLSQSQVNRVMRRGAAFPTISASMSAHGCLQAMTRS